MLGVVGGGGAVWGPGGGGERRRTEAEEEVRRWVDEASVVVVAAGDGAAMAVGEALRKAAAAAGKTETRSVAFASPKARVNATTWNREEPNGRVVMLVPQAGEAAWDTESLRDLGSLFASTTTPKQNTVVVMGTLRKSERRAETRYRAGPLRSLVVGPAPSAGLGEIPPLEPGNVVRGVVAAVIEQRAASESSCVAVLSPREVVLEHDTTLELVRGLMGPGKTLLRVLLGDRVCDAVVARAGDVAVDAERIDAKEARRHEPEGFFT